MNLPSLPPCSFSSFLEKELQLSFQKSFCTCFNSQSPFSSIHPHLLTFALSLIPLAFPSSFCPSHCKNVSNNHHLSFHETSVLSSPAEPLGKSDLGSPFCLWFLSCCSIILASSCSYAQCFFYETLHLNSQAHRLLFIWESAVSDSCAKYVLKTTVLGPER